MRRCPRTFWHFTAIAVAVPCLWPQPAHAGFTDWMNETFTFREDQKPLVAPKNTGNKPVVVIQPSYNSQQHRGWSGYYTRHDLTPQDYLTNSASKVMRPGGDMAMNGSPGSWEMINNRSKANEAAQGSMGGSGGDGGAAQGNIIISDPGEGPGVQGSDAQLGRATRIGPAVKDWREDGEGSLASRPGDYDYRPADPNRPELGEEGSLRVEELGDTSPTGRAIKKAVPVPEELKNDPRYVKFNDDGQVVRYAVQKGDSLATISAQPVIYGKPSLWPLIYSANRHTIGKNPANLKIRQELDIPRDYTEEQAKQAEKKAGRR